MKQYLDLVKTVYKIGQDVQTRSGPCRSIFGERILFDMAEGFPIVTTKYINYPAVIDELLWFLSGSTNIKDLKFTKIWDDWADEDGNLGPIYGAQWRHKSVDQIAHLIYNLKYNATSRRLLVSSWDVDNIYNMALPPCHYAFQCYVHNGYLDLMWNQRSVDLMLGLPFNIASYATLLYILARAANLKPGRLIGSLGDCHIYHNHFDGVIEQLKRETKPLPTLHFKTKDIFNYEIEDFKLINYTYHPHIKLEVSV